MIEALLLVLIVVVALAGWRPKDRYVLEWRTCSDATLAPDVFSTPPRSFDKRAMKTSRVSVETTWRDAITLRHQNGGRFTITQIAFEDLDAALLGIERFKRHLSFNTEYPYQKLYVWRVVARTRRAALVLPPSSYLAKDAHLLLEYPQHSWFSSKAGEERPSVMEAPSKSDQVGALLARVKNRTAQGRPVDQE